MSAATATFEELLEQLRTAGAAEFQRGYVAGFNAAVSALAEQARRMGPSITLPTRVIDYSEADAQDAEAGNEPSAREQTLPTDAPSRAPRGALDEVLERVLADHPGMTTPEVEVAVLSADPRIAIKSVYNRLRHWEKSGRRFRRSGQRWYRIKDFPPPWRDHSSPQGETGDVGSPASFNLALEGRPA